jgi:serine/threonine protein kinase
MTQAQAGAMVGKTVGRYALVEHLCSGGMAEIYLARHASSSDFAKDLVLKVLQDRYATMPRVVAMFLTEARLAAMLNHPHVVDVYDVGSEGGLTYIAMEYIPGRTLIDVVRRSIEVSRPVPIEQAVNIVAEAAAGLAYMHDGVDKQGQRFGLIHRDISPSNLIVSLAGQTKIIDFGIAQQGPGAGDQAEGRPGKMSYMSPEQVRGEPLDGRSDIFSLGTILYEITVGRRLWRGTKDVAMRRILDEAPPPPTFINHDYPPELEIIVLRALEKRREDRYATASDMFTDLWRYLDTIGVRSASHRIARTLHELFAPDAEISEVGLRRAEAFANDEAPAWDPDMLDFDTDTVQSGVGPNLADTLQQAGPLTVAPPMGAALPSAAASAFTPVAARMSGAVEAEPQDMDEARGVEGAQVLGMSRTRVFKWGFILLAAGLGLWAYQILRRLLSE